MQVLDQQLIDDVHWKTLLEEREMMRLRNNVGFAKTGGKNNRPSNPSPIHVSHLLILLQAKKRGDQLEDLEFSTPD